MKTNEMAQFFTMMNPDNRFFFGRLYAPTFINQRLIGLQTKEATVDVELYHALLNSILMKFYMEAVGFGRGLAVLDINKGNIANCFILNPDLLTPNSVLEIKEQFKNILAKPIMSTEEELNDEEWLTFNRTVLRAFGLEEYYIRISNSLLSMRQVRKTAREVPHKKVLVKSLDQQKKIEINGSALTPAIAAEYSKQLG